MAVALFFDVHVDHAIVAQLRLRQVDVRTAQQDGLDRLSDELLLEHAGRRNQPLVTHDVDFKPWRRIGNVKGDRSAD